MRTLLDLKDAERSQRQTALVARELDRYNIDIAALQEVRLEGQGSLQENNFTFFWTWKEPGIRREAGVGFTITNKLVKQLRMLPTGVSERLITLRISTGKTRYATIISAYEPTMNYWVKRSKRVHLLIEYFNARSWRRLYILANIPENIWKGQVKLKW